MGKKIKKGGKENSNEENMKNLHKLYYNIKKPSFLARDSKLKSELQKEFKTKVSSKTIRQFLLGQNFYAKYKKRPQKILRRPYVSYEPFQILASDLCDVSKYKGSNDNYAWVCVCVCMTTKYVFLRSLKKKDKSNMISAFDSILSSIKSYGYKLQLLAADRGTEYLCCKDYLEKKNVKLYTVLNSNKIALAELYVKLCAQRIHKLMDFKNGFRYIDHMNDIENSFNYSIATGYKYTPYEYATDRKKALQLMRDNAIKLRDTYEKIEKIEKKRDIFEIGDTVRVLKPKAIFDKTTYLPQYDKVGVIERIFDKYPKQYQISGFPSNKRFYYEELVKTDERNIDSKTNPSYILIKTKKNSETGRSLRSGSKSNQELLYLVQSIYDKNIRKFVDEKNFQELKNQGLIIDE